MKDKFNFLGAKVIVEVIDKKTGKIVDRKEAHNLVVNNSRSHVLRWFFDSTYQWVFDQPKIKVGTNGVAPDPTQTDLVEPYKEAWATRNEWNESLARREIEALFTDFTEEVHICEAGCWTDCYGTSWYGTMKNRVTFPYVVLDPTLNLKVIMYFYPV